MSVYATLSISRALLGDIEIFSAPLALERFFFSNFELSR